jgi:hypothetical protein
MRYIAILLFALNDKQENTPVVAMGQNNNARKYCEM